jgi:hypothetical protein
MMMWRRTGALAALLLIAATIGMAQGAHRGPYAGFDRNDYPGDAALPALRKSFFYTSYWLNNPPGARQNGWTGKRALLKQSGFGFLVLFNGRTDAQLKGKGVDAVAVGTADGKAAVAAARREGFSAHVMIFLDQEEGGRLLPEQAAYLFAWADAVRAGGARAGIYCSGIDVPDSGGTINTARDIVERESARAKTSPERKNAERLKLWIANDRCPPSPGCSMATPKLGAALSREIAADTIVWQYAQSPRRAQFSAGCPANHAPDGMCYAPGLPHGANSFVDLNTADSDDPSEGH